MGLPNLAYLPWTLLLSALAGLFLYRAVRAGDRGAVLRRTGCTLLPWAVYLLGLMRPVVGIADEVQRWATGFVFNPAAWVGAVLGVVAVGLIGGGAFWRRRPGSEKPPKVERGARASVPARTTRGKAQPAVDPEQDDIETILRRHNIS